MNKDFEDHVYTISSIIKLVCAENIDAITNTSKYLAQNYTQDEINSMDNETIYELYILHHHPH